MDATQTVLILGARAPVTLDLARSFGQNGWRVVLADSLKFPLSRWSKYVHAYVHLSSPVDDPENFKLHLQETIEAYAVSVCIPTCEEAFHLSKIRDELEVEVFVDNLVKMDFLHNKWEFSQRASSHFNVPDTRIVLDFNDWRNAPNFVFKPIYSRFGAETILDKDEKFVKKKIKKPDSWIAQRKVKGKEVCVYSIWKDGILQSYCLYHPKYRFNSGAGIYFEPVENEDIYRSVKSYGEHLAFTGQLSFDFIIEAGTPYVLECNPRTTSGLHLIDDQIFKSFLGEGDSSFSTKTPAKTLKFALLFSKPWLLFSLDFWQSKDVIFTWTDPLPFFMQIIPLFEFLYISLTQGISLTEAMTRDIVYNGHENRVF